MPTFYQRISSNKLIFSLLIVVAVYFLLRVAAFLKHQDFVLEGEYFSYQGKEVRYKCEGQGSPLVFLETGFGSDSEETWSFIASELPIGFTTCYYDRLGQGGSDDVPRTFTTEQKSQLQEALIKHIAADKPVVLVAKSYGGIISRRTVARDNLNLAALILLDSAHENQHAILHGKLEPIAEYVKIFQYVNAALALADIKNVFKTYESPLAKRLDQYYGSVRWAHVLSTYRNEKGFYTPLEDFNYNFGKLKMLVLSHDREAYASVPRFYEIGELWAEMQKEIAELSDNSEHIVIKGATHNMTADAPQVVIAKINETVNSIQ